MSATIDQRVVEMRFDNRQFESNVKTSMSTLDKLKEKLKLSDSSKGLEQVNTAAKNFDTSQMSNSLETVKAKFSSLQVIGTTALAKLTTSAMTAASKIANAITSSLIQGGWNRAMNIEQAKFQLEGLGYAWEDVADDIDYAVKGTAYGLDAAAKACSQLVASSVQVGDDMKTALRGISGVAAMTNSSYEDISHIFTRIAGNGRVYAIDLQSISSRGINAAAALGKHINKTEAEIREMVSDGAIDFATFAKAMDSAFGEHAKDANKTFTGALSNTKAALSRLGADVAGPALLNLRDIFNGLRETIDNARKSLTPFIEVLNNAQNSASKMAVKFIELGGLKSILSGIGNIFKGIWTALKPIKDAFVDIFPMGTVENLVKATARFSEITKKFKLSDKTAAKLKDTFKGLFAVLDVGVEAVKALGKGLIGFLGHFKGLGGAILTATAALGRFLVKLRNGVETTGIFKKIINGLNSTLGFVVEKFKSFKDYILAKLGLEDLHGITNVFAGLLKIVTSLGSKIVELGKSFADNLSNDKVQAAMGIAGALLMMRQAALKYIAVSSPMKHMWIVLKRLHTRSQETAWFLPNISSALSALKNSLWSLNRTLKYQQLMNYAKALALLAGSMLLISLIDADKMGKALSAVSVLVVELVGVLSVLESMATVNIVGFKGFFSSIMGIVKASEMASSLIKLSIALLILAGAIKVLGSMDAKDMLKGFVGVTGLMILLIGTMKQIATDGSAIIKGAGQMLVMSFALTVLTGALKIIASMSWPDLAKGALGLLAITTILVTAARVMQTQYSSITKFAGQMLIMAISLTVLAGVLKIIASMSWEELGRGLAGIAAVMLILGVTLKALSTIKGDLIAASGAILIMTVAIRSLAGTLMLIGAMSWGTIAKGLVTIAGALTIFGVAAALLMSSGAAVAMMFCAKAMALFGLSVLAIGVGLVAAAAGIFALVQTITVGATSIVTGLTIIIVGLIDLLPAIIAALVQGLKTIVLTLLDIFVDAIPKIVKGLLTLVHEVLSALVEYTPTIVGLIFDFLINVINTLATKIPELVVALVNLLSKVMQGVIDTLKTVDPKVLMNGIAAIGLLAALMVTLAATASLVPAALIGVLGMSAVITEIAVVLAALGALSYAIPDLQWFIDEGGYLLESIGTAIGRFVGGIVGGIAKGATSSLPGIAEDLSNFMTAIMPFIDGIKKVDSSTLKGAVTLAGVMVALSSAQFTQKLTSWLTGKSALEDIGKSLAKFAPYLVEYASIIKDVDTVAITKSANAAKALTEMAKSIPNTGGVASWFAGDNDIADFSKGLIAFGEGLKGFSDSVKGVKVENITAAANAAKPLVELAQNIPNSGGVASWFSGDNDISDFSEGLIELGKGLKGFSDGVAGIVPGNVEAATKGAKALAEMAKTIPNSGGVASWFAGDNSVANFSESLAGLGKGLKGFSDGVAGIAPENVKHATDAAKSLAEMASIIPNSGGVASWFAGDNSVADFGDSLIGLGKSLKGFSDGVAGIVPENITAAASAAKSLAEMASIIPNSGGVAAWFEGDNSISAYSEDLKSLGAGIKGFSDNVSGINAENVSAASTAAKTLAEMTSVLPNSGGVAAWFAGEYSISKFSGELKSLGVGIKGFSDSVVGIVPENVTAAANAAKTIAEITSIIPNSGGVAAWFEGDNSLASFGEDMKLLGVGIKGFSDSVVGIVPENVTAAVTAAKNLAELTNILPNSGGVAAWFAGEYSISKFSGELKSLGVGIKGFSDAIGDGINTANVTAAANAAKTLAEMASTIPADSSKIVTFGTNITSFAKNLKNYFTSTSGISADAISETAKVIEHISTLSSSISATSISSAADAIIEITDAIKAASKVKKGAADGIVNSISTIGKASVTGLIEEFANSEDRLKTAGENLMSKFISGVKDKETAAKEAAKSIASSCAASISSTSGEFSSAGKSVVSGFAAGITNNTWMATARARAMARAAANAAKAELDVNSPSKVFMAIGACVPEGFAKGISKYSDMVSDPIREMTNTAVNGVGRSIARMTDVINSNIDTQPTIRPVLDLSDVTSGAKAMSSMFGLQPSVGVMSRVGSISASMNRRQNGNGFNDVVSAIRDLKRDMADMSGNTYQINGITYDDGSNVADAVKSLVRAARIERRV